VPKIRDKREDPEKDKEERRRRKKPNGRKGERNKENLGRRETERCLGLL
jgi:hypothetical protein